MLIETARRAETAAKEMLALVNEGSASSEEIREALAVSKAITGINTAFQAAGAAAVAGRERHGDGGAEVLASTAGLSRREANSQVKTAEAIRNTPRLRDAVESGRVSVANAKRLAEAVDKTSAADVEADSDLLAKAETMRPEQFTKEARRWVTDRDGDGGAAEHARQRARRCVRMWDSDDGLVHLHGQFDSVTGERIRNRLRAEAARMYDGDKQAARQNAKDTTTNGCADRRTFDQCMADALDNLTNLTAVDSSASGSSNGGGKPFADIAVVWHLNANTEKTFAEIAGGDRLPASVLEELMCNCAVTGLIYNTEGVPLWRGQTKRRATPGQMRALIAKYGGCFHCGAHPAMCQAHHIKPWWLGGPTDISNLVLACWNCHQRIHHHGWQIRTHLGQHTLHPPDPVVYGPAHAADPPPTPEPGSRRGPHRDAGTPRPRQGAPPSPQPRVRASTDASPRSPRDGSAEPSPASRSDQLFAPV